MTEHAKRLHELAAHAFADRVLASAACRTILDAPEVEQPDLFFRYLLEHKYTAADADRLAASHAPHEDGSVDPKHCAQLLEQWLTELNDPSLSEEAFHAALWGKIRDLSNDSFRIDMVFACGENPLLPRLSPQRTAPGDAFTTESMKDAVEQMDPLLPGLVSHILNQDYERVSQDAAALLPLLDLCRDRQEQVALLTAMFLAVHEKMQLSHFRDVLHEAADRAMEELIREATEEWDS